MNTSDIKPKNCFVGMFDIVGFKALRARKGTEGLYQQFIRGILPAITHSAAGKSKTETINGTPMYVPDFAGSTLRYKVISDSVIFYTPDDTFDSFFTILNSSFLLLQFGFNGGKAPYRGAIGWGDLIDDPAGILLGSAIEDAYIGESMQVWAGAMLTEECRNFVDKNSYIQQITALFEQFSQMPHDDSQKRIVREDARKLVVYSVPTQINPKDGPVKYSTLSTYVIDWTIRMYENASHKAFDSSTNLHASTIAQNTREFEQWARNQRS
jgi:hypothetical protein